MKTQYQNLIDWFATYVPAPVISVHEIVLTPYSLVLKICTDNSEYYLKQMPEQLFVEARILDILSEKCGVRSIPRKIAENTQLRCFISESCGTETLRSFFNGKLNPEILQKGMECYHDIQNATIPYLDAFLDIGVPDWRTRNLSRLYDEILKDTQFIEFIGLTGTDIEKLEKNKSKLHTMCQELQNLNIPDTLNHADFQNNNIVIDHASGDLSIIDWGEVYIGNPLLSHHYCITSARYQYNMESGGPDYTLLEKAVFDPDLSDNKNARKLIHAFYPLIHSLAWHSLIEKTGYSLHASKSDRVRRTLLEFAE